MRKLQAKPDEQSDDLLQVSDEKYCTTKMRYLVVLQHEELRQVRNILDQKCTLQKTPIVARVGS